MRLLLDTSANGTAARPSSRSDSLPSLDFLPELDPGTAGLLTSPRSAGVTGPFAASELSGLGSFFAFVLIVAGTFTPFATGVGLAASLRSFFTVVDGVLGSPFGFVFAVAVYFFSFLTRGLASPLALVDGSPSRSRLAPLPLVPTPAASDSAAASFAASSDGVMSAPAATLHEMEQ